jgi:hypothetical protein
MSDSAADNRWFYAELGGNRQIAPTPLGEEAEFRLRPAEAIHRRNVKVTYARVVGRMQKAQPLRRIRSAEKAGAPEAEGRRPDREIPEDNSWQRHDLPVGEELATERLGADRHPGCRATWWIVIA